MENELPEGWVETTIGEVNSRKSKTIDPGSTPEKTFELYSVPIFDSRLPELIKGSEIKSSKQIVSEDEVLVCKINPRINRVWKVGNFTNHQKIASSEWIVVNSNGVINPDFLRYQFSAPFFRSILQSEVSGVGGSLTRARPKLVDDYAIYLAPLAEQTRIVAKLDATFSHLETLKTSLARVPDLLKKFRQTVLTQAVTGKLTESWREENPEVEDSSLLMNRIFDYKQEWATDEALKGNSEARRLLSRLKHPKTIETENVPEKWGLVSLYDACQLVVDCHNKTAPYESSGIYLVRTTNVKNGRILIEDIKYISEDTYDYWARRCPPKPGDIIFTREAPMGEAAIIPAGMQICLGQRTMLFRMPGELLLNKYVLYTLLAPTMITQIKDKAVGMGVEHLRVGDVESLMISLPPLEEQQEIVNRVEALFAQADALEAQYQSLKAKIDKLPQALLAKAFRGELVPQDPTDEPASVLLEKIKAATAAVGKRSRKSGQTALAFMEE